MKIFGQIVRTLVNVAVLPVSIGRDVYGMVVGEGATMPITEAQLQKIKDEAEETK